MIERKYGHVHLHHGGPRREYVAFRVEDWRDKLSKAAV